MNCPGATTLITPPHIHIAFEAMFKAGKLLIMTVGEPGAHGAVTTGMHGMGVSTPRAAVVAVATTGLVGVIHIPKGGIFAIGAKSIIVAAIGPPAIAGGPFGMVTRLLGATPKVHIIVAPIAT